MIIVMKLGIENKEMQKVLEKLKLSQYEHSMSTLAMAKTINVFGEVDPSEFEGFRALPGVAKVYELKVNAPRPFSPATAD